METRHGNKSDGDSSGSSELMAVPRVHDEWLPEILHALPQPLQQELDVLRDVLVVVLLLLQVLQLLQHLALNHGQGVLLASLPLCRLLEEILLQGKTIEEA